jgi:hypothetical protein
MSFWSVSVSSHVVVSHSLAVPSLPVVTNCRQSSGRPIRAMRINDETESKHQQVYFLGSDASILYPVRPTRRDFPVQAVEARSMGAELGDCLEQTALSVGVDGSGRHILLFCGGGVGCGIHGAGIVTRIRNCDDVVVALVVAEVVVVRAVAVAPSWDMMRMRLPSQAAPRRVPHKYHPMIANRHERPRVFGYVDRLDGNDPLLIHVTNSLL